MQRGGGGKGERREGEEGGRGRGEKGKKREGGEEGRRRRRVHIHCIVTMSLCLCSDVKI